MIKLTRSLAVGVITISSLGLFAGPAPAASNVTKTTSCSTSAAKISVTFGATDDATRYGTLRSAFGSAEGAFSDDPAMTVRVRDGYGRLIVTRRTTDGSLSLPFWRKIGGPNWTAQATIENTTAGPCTTPRVKIAVT